MNLKPFRLRMILPMRPVKLSEKMRKLCTYRNRASTFWVAEIRKLIPEAEKLEQPHYVEMAIVFACGAVVAAIIAAIVL